jgi:hypothetical protein
MLPRNFKLRAEVLLFSVVLVFVATPFLENDRTGEGIIVLTMYLILVTATLQLSGQRSLFFLPLLSPVPPCCLYCSPIFIPRNIS